MQPDQPLPLDVVVFFNIAVLAGEGVLRLEPDDGALDEHAARVAEEAAAGRPVLGQAAGRRLRGRCSLGAADELHPYFGEDVDGCIG